MYQGITSQVWDTNVQMEQQAIKLSVSQQSANHSHSKYKNIQNKTKNNIQHNIYCKLYT